MNQVNQNKQEDNKLEEKQKKPNETGGFYFSSSVKITDPDTNEILLQKRGDN